MGSLPQGRDVQVNSDERTAKPIGLTDEQWQYVVEGTEPELTYDLFITDRINKVVMRYSMQSTKGRLALRMRLMTKALSWLVASMAFNICFVIAVVIHEANR